MGDVVRYTEGGREYAVFGLDAKATAIGAGAQATNDDIAAATEAAVAALVGWRGPHSATMAEQHNAVVAAAFDVYV